MTMANKITENVETTVRDAAVALLAAITQARKAGYVVQWPDTPDDLARIAVSETASVAASVADAGDAAASEPEPALQPEPQPDATDVPAIPLRSRS